MGTLDAGDGGGGGTPEVRISFVMKCQAKRIKLETFKAVTHTILSYADISN